jgi:rRNA biogenesis protein RRP5
MKILGQIVSVQPLALIISLPNQLLAHVPITHISSQLTALLETMDGENDGTASEDGDEDETASKAHIPDLFELFRPGQHVRAVVTAIHEPGSNEMTGIGKTRDQVSNASRRVELSLVPERVNAGVQKADLRKGYVSLVP